jgi:hypothetical protein
MICSMAMLLPKNIAQVVMLSLIKDLVDVHCVEK